MPKVEDFRAELRLELSNAQKRGAPAIEIEAGQLHRKLGGYPPSQGQHHQMPTCCSAMYAEMGVEDQVVASPPKGKGASLKIRYKLPRSELNHA